jgi:hypothetical protein
MKDPASTRFSAFRCALIGLPLLAGIVWQERELDRLRADHAALLAKAAARGIDPAGNALPSRKSDRSRPDPLAEARDLAGTLILRAGSEDRDHSDWVAQISLVERLQALKPSQLEEMIRIVLDAGDMPPAARFHLLFHLLRRLGTDRPEEALALAAKMETRRPDHHVQYRIDLVISSLAARLAKKDPEAAWTWFVQERQGWEEHRIKSTLPTLLGGISQVDPALALRRAGETGLEDISFLSTYGSTPEQKLATLSALRTWSRDDAGKREKMRVHIQRQTLPTKHDENNRFDEVIAWIDRARLTNDELGFFTHSASFDIGSRIDPRETGKWIDWLSHRFPDEEIAGQVKRLFKDKRTGEAARAWRDALPPSEAADFNGRFGVD